MSRILLPLDGSHEAEAVIPDGCDLAGPNGHLVLLHVIPALSQDHGTDGFVGRSPLAGSEDYLESKAAPLRSQGFTIDKRSDASVNVSAAIDEAAVRYEVDLTALTTHGRGPAGRLAHGGVAWRTVANSHVPVLLRHVEAPESMPKPVEQAHIMVPLDGSHYGEKVLPLVQRLALQWSAKVTFVRVVADYLPLTSIAMEERMPSSEQAGRYLRDIAAAFAGNVGLRVLEAGDVVHQLARFAQDSGVSHVVMASHGRTALTRVILGSVADDLVHSLHMPIIVVPALASGRIEDHDSRRAVAPGSMQTPGVPTQ